MSWFRACSCVVLSFTFCAVQLLGCGAEASSDRISQVTGQLHLLDHQEPPAGVSPEVKRVLLERCANVAWSGETVPLTKELLPLDVPEKCSIGDRRFGDRLVLIARHKENLTDIAVRLAVPFLVYTASFDDDAAYHRSAVNNIGNEVGSYLSFIVDYYNCLPDAVLFAHAHRFSKLHTYHTLDFDANNVRWDKIPGFAPKHRQGAWHEVGNIRNPSLIWQHRENLTLEQANTFPCTQVHKGEPYVFDDSHIYSHAKLFNRAWDELFGPLGLGEKPDRIRCSVFAEMFVTAETIRRHPRDFYLKILRWMHTSLFSGALNTWEIGGVFELSWHIIFGQPAYMEKLLIPECELFRCNETAAILDHQFLHKAISAIRAAERKAAAEKAAAAGKLA